MPLGTWLRSWNPTDLPPERPASAMVADSLMMEMDYQIRELEEERRQKQQEEKRAQGGVDYGWLAASAPRETYQMPQLERLDLEQLCTKVKRDECGRVIIMFRDALSLDPPIEDVPKLMRASVLHVLDTRPKEETVPEWLTKSLTNLTKLRPVSRKVSPLCHPSDDDLEMQRAQESSLSTVSSSVSSLPNFYVKSESMHI